MSPFKPKLAHHMSAPRVLSPEEMAQATEEARQFRENLDRATRGMETLTVEDLAIRIR